MILFPNSNQSMYCLCDVTNGLKCHSHNSEQNKIYFSCHIMTVIVSSPCDFPVTDFSDMCYKPTTVHLQLVTKRNISTSHWCHSDSFFMSCVDNVGVVRIPLGLQAFTYWLLSGHSPTRCIRFIMRQLIVFDSII